MNWFKRTIARLFGIKVENTDRPKPIELWRRYGNGRVAERDEASRVDLVAPDYNANVYVAIRAIVDAIRKLDVRIVVTEMVNGRETEVADTDHDANQIIRRPNPDMTLREVVSHNVRSMLADGNAIMTIERMTGPNARLEIWPRDPREVERLLNNGRPGNYKIGKNADRYMIYPPNRIVHIREVNPANPLWGQPRHQAVRDEIYLDHVVNTFNKKFFQQGAAISLMFNPSQELTDIQHQQIRESLNADLAGVEEHFKILVNKYPGKLESASPGNKEIGFSECYRHCREKIFSVYGLPPFRGGVMEYANYANALAQDKDFWLNTVQPITAILEDAYNKQLIWPYFGEDVSLKFDYSEVPAIKGEPEELARVHQIYINSGVLTVDEVRGQLGLSPLPEAVQPQLPPTDGPVEPGSEDEMPPATEPTQDEQNSLRDGIYKVFRKQSRELQAAIRAYTANGAMMSRLILPERDAVNLFDRAKARHDMIVECHPALKTMMRGHCIDALRRARVSARFDAESKPAGRLLESAALSFADLNQDSLDQLKSVLHDADAYGWDLSRLLKEANRIFGYKRACQVARPIMHGHCQRIDLLVRDIWKQDSEAFIKERSRANA